MINIYNVAECILDAVRAVVREGRLLSAAKPTIVDILKESLGDHSTPEVSWKAYATNGVGGWQLKCGTLYTRAATKPEAARVMIPLLHGDSIPVPQELLELAKQ